MRKNNFNNFKNLTDNRERCVIFIYDEIKKLHIMYSFMLKRRKLSSGLEKNIRN